jgi:hypothetical protein
MFLPRVLSRRRHRFTRVAVQSLGFDPNDPAAKDAIVTPTLTVPVNHPVELLLRSQDVVHDFFVHVRDWEVGRSKILRPTQRLRPCFPLLGCIKHRHRLCGGIYCTG